MHTLKPDKHVMRPNEDKLRPERPDADATIQDVH